MVELLLEPVHAGEPGVGVGGALLVVAAHLRVREHVEGVGRERLPRGVGDLVGRERRVEGEEVLERAGAVEHPRLHALGADRLHDDPAVAVGRAQPLGEGDGAVLAHGVGRVAEHRQQPGRRRGDDEAPATGVEPARHEEPGGAHVGEDVGLERAGPLVVGGVETLEGADARVGEEDVDVAEVVVCRVDEVGHAGIGRRVAGDGEGARLVSDGLQLGGVEVGDDDLPALARESGRDGATDPPGGPGDDGGVGHAAPRCGLSACLP